MKHIKCFSFLILFLLARVTLCAGQDKPTIVSQRMFHTEADDAVFLSDLDGWFFRPGNDTAWARTDINMAGWQKLRPKELSVKNAGKNGRVEGWFRIKIKPDSTINVKGLSIGYNSYAAADIYVNGKLLGSFGQTGLYGHPYAENDGKLLASGLPLALKPGDQFTLAFHIVDTLAPIGKGKLKFQLTNSVDLIYLLKADSDNLDFINFLNLSKSYSIWVSVCLTLCFLFWLMAFQNRSEKVFFYIAWCSTFFVSYIYCQSLNLDLPSCASSIIYSALTNVSLILILVSLPVVIAKVFKRRLLPWVKIVLAVFIAYASVAIFLPWTSKIHTGAAILFSVGIGLYYITSSWKNVRGASWCIVGGLLGTFFFLLCIIAAASFFKIYRTTWVLYLLLTAFILSFPVSLLVYVAVRFKEIINEVRANAAQVLLLSEEKRQEALNRQKVLEEAVNRQTAEIRSNQARLIQAEKMASLGELTAGIAHEIQNPLNFVNNFSDVSVELIDEMQTELKSGDKDEAIAISEDIKQNLEKIRHHGKRADFIVKGMLEHSRTSTGEKQPTDMNVLCDEFMKLSYHGLRAKDKNFNAELVTHFNEKLPKAIVSQQDIGRVMLNLFNNAFYAVNEKKRTAGVDYKPQVTVTTASGNGLIIVKVKDNGNGIHDAIKDKIMQPFFTTKPTGEGTGLGLSLSYDIVVKGHGGSIAVETSEGEFTEFVVTLPI